MATDGEMCAAVWTWLTGKKAYVLGDYAVYDRGAVWAKTADSSTYTTPVIRCSVPDYLHDEAASAGLLEELAGRVDVLEVLRISGNWTVGWPCHYVDRATVMGVDPDRKRAILLAAWEASKA